MRPFDCLTDHGIRPTAMDVTSVFQQLMSKQPRKAMAFAFVLGLLSALGFQPLNLWPLTIVTVALLIMLVRGAEQRGTALWAGWWFGLGHFGLSLNWIATAFTYQAAMPAWLGWVAVILLSLYMALFPAVAAWIGKLFGRRDILRTGLFMASGWMFAEWVRSWLFTGFAWNPLGASLLPLTAVAQAASVIGGLGLSAIVVLCATLVCLLLACQWGRAAVLTVPLVLIAIGGAFYMQRPAGEQGARVRIVQPNIGQDEKWAEETGAAIAARFASLSGTADGQKRLLLWPEAAVREYLEEDIAARLRLAQLLGPDDLLMAGGIGLVHDDKGEIIGARNALFVMDNEGRLRSRYDKAHLVPYGEYLPMRPLLSLIGLSRLAPGELDFIPGRGPQTLDLPGFGAAGVQICYEIIFSGQVVDQNNRPDFLFNPSNDAWFGAWGPPQHLAQARMRAIEEGLPIARSTPTGISAIIDGQGRVLARVGYQTVGVIDMKMPGALPPTVFARLGSSAAAILGLVLILAGAFVRPFRLAHVE